VDVIGTEEMDLITYQILGRGDIIVTRTLSANGQKNFNFRFLASFAMVPKASLIVYYIRADGEIISDSIKFELGDELQNFVSF
jgi:CD109 antigen